MIQSNDDRKDTINFENSFKNSCYSKKRTDTALNYYEKFSKSSNIVDKLKIYDEISTKYADLLKSDECVNQAKATNDSNGNANNNGNTNNNGNVENDNNNGKVSSDASTTTVKLGSLAVVVIFTLFYFF